MDANILKKLHTEALITTEQLSLLTRIYGKSLFSLYFELRTMLYFGVLLFATGTGILVYQNIGTIGHQTIIALLVVLAAACFWYTTKRKRPYSDTQVESPGTLYDYILLLGSLIFATIVNYVQYQYTIFGTRWELGALISALVFLFLAYAHDHRGVLSLGITALASWLGLTVSPIEMMKQGIVATDSLIITGIWFGAAVIGISLILDQRNIKKHFTFTALSLVSHVLFISCLAALFNLQSDWLYFTMLIASCAGGIMYARKEQSFMFLLISTVYGYAGLTYMLRDFFSGLFGIYFYFIASCGAIIYFVFNHKKLPARP